MGAAPGGRVLKTRGSFLAVVLMLTICGLSRPHADAADVQLRALLIGVGSPGALDGEFEQLSAGHDVSELDRALRARGVPPGEIHSLTGASATRVGILSAIRTHLASAPPRAQLLLHWSGHGVQVVDDSGDEPDGLDEAWVPFGGSAERPGSLLIDDELGAALDAVRLAIGPSGALVVTVDACHGAGSTRGTHAIPLQLDSGDLTRRAGDGRAPLVVLAAARSDQQAREVLGPAGRPIGAFSSALADVLSSQPPPRTWRAVHERVRARLDRVVPGQRPQIEGVGELPVLGADPIASSWYLPVVGVLSDGRVRVEGGRLHGVVPGSRLEFHRDAGDAPSMLSLLATGMVLESSATSALVRLEDSDLDAEGLVAAHAFLAEAPSSSLTVSLDGPSDWKARWTPRIRAAGFTVRDGPADFTLALAGDLERLAVWSSSEVLSEAVVGDGAQAIELTLRRIVSADRVRSFELSDPAFAVAARLVRAQPQSCDVIGEVHHGSDGAPLLEVGDTIRLEVQHQGELPAWLTVVHVDELGLGEQLLPTAEELAEPLRPGGTWRAPTCWTVTPPARGQFLRVLATRKPAALGVLLDGQALRAPPPEGFAVDLALHVREPLAGRSP